MAKSLWTSDHQTHMFMYIPFQIVSLFAVIITPLFWEGFSLDYEVGVGIWFYDHMKLLVKLDNLDERQLRWDGKKEQFSMGHMI